jgi:hypothetical protein
MNILEKMNTLQLELSNIIIASQVKIGMPKSRRTISFGSSQLRIDNS